MMFDPKAMKHFGTGYNKKIGMDHGDLLGDKIAYNVISGIGSSKPFLEPSIIEKLRNFQKGIEKEMSITRITPSETLNNLNETIKKGLSGFFPATASAESLKRFELMSPEEQDQEMIEQLKSVEKYSKPIQVCTTCPMTIDGIDHQFGCVEYKPIPKQPWGILRQKTETSAEINIRCKSASDIAQEIRNACGNKVNK